MTNFRTELNLDVARIDLNHHKSTFCIGSCFAEHIAQRLSDAKFSTFVNPFGIVYNPISMAEQIDFLLCENIFTKEAIFQQGELWHSFMHHGHFSQLNAAETLDKINISLENARFFLKKTNVLILTLGTANVFFHKKTNRIVANCHKVPQQAFEKQRLGINEIVDKLNFSLKELKKSYPHLEVILTVSPIRHLKDGFLENQRSKATLLLAIDELQKTNDFIHYFPAYELLLDDLRDYRFYESDMIHPTQQAVDYIWEKFQSTFFSKETLALLKPIGQIVSAARHRPFHPTSLEYQKFIQHQKQEIARLEQEYPYLDFSKEKKCFT